MARPTCAQIAESELLWNEYIDVSGQGVKFDEMTYTERLAIIHDLWPEDCNCYIEDEE